MAAVMADGDGVTISKSDITAASAETWAWIDGFLVGSEPTLEAFLGVDPEDADDIGDDDSAVSRWRDSLDVFRRTGQLPFPLNRRPTGPPPADLDARRMWALAGGQVLHWRRGAWVAGDPQPAMQYALMAGTVCAERGHCEVQEEGEHHLVCVDCGQLTELTSPPQ